MNLIFFFLTYFIVLISCFSYGFTFCSKLQKRLKLDVEYYFLFALLFLTIISYLTHFFVSHNYFHNLIIFTIGIILFFFLFINNQKIFFKELKLILILSSVLFIGLIIFKAHDDFHYYHFPYTYFLTQEKIIFGVGSINHGFRTPSSIFYLNSIFYLPGIKFYSFHFGTMLLYSSAIYIFLAQLNRDLRNKNFDFIFFLKLLSLLFVLIFFYRISEHGTDRTAQVLIFLLFIELFSLFRKKSNFNEFISKYFLLLSLIISLKSFYILYIITIVPIWFYLKGKNFSNLFRIIVNNLSFQIFILLFFIILIVNLSNSGCLIYPVSFTCIPFLDWSLSNEAQLMNNWYELWSKGGANPNFRVVNPDKYIEGFNWVNNWIDSYFFNKVSDFLLGLFSVIIIFYFLFRSKIKKKIIIGNYIQITIIVLIVLFSEWFYNHPSLRYGGFVVIALIIFIPLSIILSKNIHIQNIKKKVLCLVVLSIIIFTVRNFDRILDEKDKYDYKPLTNVNYKLDNQHFRIDKYIKEKKKILFNCKMTKNINCEFNDTITMYKKNRYFFLKKND